VTSSPPAGDLKKSSVANGVDGKKKISLVGGKFLFRGLKKK